MKQSVSGQWRGSVPERFTAVGVNNQEERKEFKERSKSKHSWRTNQRARRSMGRRLTERNINSLDN